MEGKGKNASTRRRSSIMGYEQSLMFGHYREQLANFARVQVQKTKQLEEGRKELSRRSSDEAETFGQQVRLRLHQVIEIAGDWIILALLGVIIASLSFSMDIVIHACFHGLSNFKRFCNLLTFFSVREWLMDITPVFAYQYMLWIAHAIALIGFAALFVRLVSPQAAGSGNQIRN